MRVDTSLWMDWAPYPSADHTENSSSNARLELQFGLPRHRYRRANPPGGWSPLRWIAGCGGHERKLRFDALLCSDVLASSNFSLDHIDVRGLNVFQNPSIKRLKCEKDCFGGRMQKRRTATITDLKKMSLDYVKINTNAPLIVASNSI